MSALLSRDPVLAGTRRTVDHFRGNDRSVKEKVDRLSEEEITRLQDRYDAARAGETLKAIEEGRSECVSGEELRKELDRICAEADRRELLR